MTYAIVENGIVLNVVEATAEFAASQGWKLLKGGAGIGWTFHAGIETFSPPEHGTPPEGGPRLTKRQIVRALVLSGTPDPEAFIETAIAAIEDETARGLALADWRYAPYYDRTHPLFNDEDVLTAASMNAAQIDQLWRLASGQPE